jgi:hypothetical protein
MIEELKARMARTLDEWRDFEPEDDWSGYQRDHKLALSALSAVPVMKEAISDARDLMQTAKGLADGPDGGSVTDHLDLAEHRLVQALAALEGK